MANLSNINGKFVVEQTTGYVGVGTTDPNYPIEVLNASAEIALNASGASIYRLRSDNTDSFRINKNGVGDRLVIAGNGNATFAGKITAPTLSIQNQINTTSSNLEMNYANGDGTTTNFKDFYIRDGKNAVILNIQGSSKNATFAGGITATFGNFSSAVNALYFRTAAANTDYNLFTRNNTGNTIFVQAAQSNASQPIAKFSYGSATVNAGTAVLQVSKDNSHFVNCNVGIGTTSPGTFLQLGSYPVSGTYVNNATYPDVPSEHMIHLTAPSTTGYFGGGISFGENAFTAANITAVDAGGGGALHLAFGTGNSSGMTERVRIANNGNVGIGTDSPGYKLNVINNNTATWTARFTNNTNNVYLSVNDANNYGIYVSGETKNYFSGNVGIGTTSPAQKLHINGNVRVGTDTGFIDFARPGGAIVGGIGWHTDDYFYVAGHPTAGTGAGNNVRVYAFGSLLSLGNPTAGDALTVAVNGNIGIGVTSPAQKLQVSGNTYVTGYVQASSALIGLKDGYATLGSNSTATGIALSRDFLPSSYPDLIINSSGNVGIGITSPQDKLHVNGDAIISSTRFGDFSVANISTTGYAIATISASTNGQSAIVEFVASGNNGGYYNVVYSCYNGGGVWYYTKNVVGSGGNIEVAETNGAGSSTLVFYFRATSGTASYTPRVMMKGMPYNLVTF